MIFQKGSRPYKSVALHMHEAGLKQCAILLTQWTPLFLYIPGPLCDVVFKKAASEVSFSLRAGAAGESQSRSSEVVSIHLPYQLPAVG